MSQTRDDAPAEGWHLDKKVPIGIVLAILTQTVSFTWFMGKQDARISLIEQSRIEHTAAQKDRDERQDADNAAAFKRVDDQLTNMNSKLDRLIERGIK